MALPEQARLAELFAASLPLYEDKPWLRVYSSGGDEPDCVIRQSEYYERFNAADHRQHLDVIAEHGTPVPELEILQQGRVGYIATAWITSIEVSPVERLAAMRASLGGLKGYEDWVARTGQPVILNDIFDPVNLPFTYGSSPRDTAPQSWFTDVEPRIHPAERHIPGSTESLYSAVDFFTQMAQSRAQQNPQ
jgi:hypothetical protein